MANKFFDKCLQGVLVNGSDDFRIKSQESLLIHCDGPQLNKATESAPLILFS